MLRNLVYVGIGTLAIIAVFFGYKIYEQQVLLKQVVSNNPVQLPVQPSKDSGEEDLARSAPSASTSATERNNYYQKLQQFAKDATTIEITNCKPSPLIARVKENTAPYIVNNDNIEHILWLGGTELKVEAKGTISVKIGKIDQYTNLYCVNGSQGLWIPYNL